MAFERDIHYRDTVEGRQSHASEACRSWAQIMGTFRSTGITLSNHCSGAMLLCRIADPIPSFGAVQGTQCIKQQRSLGLILIARGARGQRVLPTLPRT